VYTLTASEWSNIVRLKNTGDLGNICSPNTLKTDVSVL